MSSRFDERGHEAFAELNARVGGRLLRIESPMRACLQDPESGDCNAALEKLHNPFFHEDEPGAFQTTGWLDAFAAAPSSYAVSATSAEDIATTVAFARDHSVPLVIKGTGHDYLGRSSKQHALLIWTHQMRDIALHRAYRIASASDDAPGVPAVTIGAGTRWLEVFQATAEHGRMVQGGGCTSVGAAGGFTQGGGFGSFTKRFGTAAGCVLEIEVVTADGEILVVNEAQHRDLFWALRGGGGGTFGVVSKLTMLTHEIPTSFGVLAGRIDAKSDSRYRRLIRAIVDFIPRVNNEHWGEQLRLGGDNSVELNMTMLDLSVEEGRAVWQPLVDRLADAGGYSVDLKFAARPFDTVWNLEWWRDNHPEVICLDERADGGSGHFWWTSNQGEVSQYLNAYQSRWLPNSLFGRTEAAGLTDAMFEASRQYPFSIHMNKGLAGASAAARDRDANTSINPVALDAVALAIMASAQQYVYAGVPGHEPDRVTGRAEARRINAAMQILRDATPGSGAYVNEADFFEHDWQQSFWGSNYPRLLAIKKRYDPDNLFRVHHGVGSEF